MSDRYILGISAFYHDSAAALLRNGEDILGATFEAGYGSTSRVYERVTGGLGMTPSAIRNEVERRWSAMTR